MRLVAVLLLFFFTAPPLPTKFETFSVDRYITQHRHTDRPYPLTVNHITMHYHCRIDFNETGLEILIADTSNIYALAIDSIRRYGWWSGDSAIKYFCTYRRWGWKKAQFFDKTERVKVQVNYWPKKRINSKEDAYDIIVDWLKGDSSQIYRARPLAG